MKSGDYAGARLILEMLIAETPRSAEAHNLLGVCLGQLNDTAESAAQFRKAIQLEPHYENALLNLGSTLFAVHDDVGAISVFNQLLRVDPQSKDGHLALARILLAGGEESMAFPHLERVIQLDPHNTFALANAGLIESRKGDLGAAAGYISRALLENPRSIPLQLALIELDLKRGETKEATTLSDRITHDTSLTRAQKQTLASLLLTNGFSEKGAELVDGDRDLSQQFRDAAIARAKQQFMSNRFEDSVRTLEGIQNLRPQNAEFHELLGLAWYETGDARKASDELQQAIRLEPHNPDRYFQLGLVYLKHHTPALADIVFEHGLVQVPDSARLRLGLGLSQYLGDDTTRAQQSVQKALMLDPGLVEGYIVLGDILESDGRLSEASDVFHQAIEKKPDLYIGYYYCGKVALEAGEGRTDQALAFFAKAIALNPDFAEAHFERGRALEQSGSFKQAIVEYKTSLAKNASLSQAHYRLGIVYRNLGQTQTASNELSIFQKMKPKERDSVVERLDYRIR
jgi:tetratricopeptide (TPR) repeat protein